MAKGAALTALEPLLADTLADTPGAEARLVQAIAQHLRGESPAASGWETLRHTLDAVRHGAGGRPGHAATRALLLATADAVREVLAEAIQAPAPHPDPARLPQTALDLAERGATEQLRHAHAVLATLASEDAATANVARLRFYVGLDIDDIAVVLDMTSTTVRRAWNRVRTRLRS